MIQPRQRLRIKWFIEFQYSSRNHHGAILRFVNYSSEMLARGHQVSFVISCRSADADCSLEWFEQLKQTKQISSYFFIGEPLPGGWHTLLGSLDRSAVSEGPRQRDHLVIIEQARAIVREHPADLFIVSSRRLFFLLKPLDREAPWVIDFGDSECLYFYRQARHLLGEGKPGAALYSLRRMVGEAIIEAHYGRISTANLAVSAIDSQVIARLSGSAAKTVTVPNGVRTGPESPSPQKIANQIVFSGNMDFPPNYEAALWLIDRVLPILVKEEPKVRLVIAGPNPIQELLKRSSERVRIVGFIEDLYALIRSSALYVAPMVSGSGFKNKVVEALLCGTFVVSTPIGVEFLAPQFRELVPVASNPPEFAAQVLACLRNPAALEEPLRMLHNLVLQEFSWTAATDRLLEALFAAAGKHPEV
jgi:glycosyltransferase involved in cell wall biosynthesis